MSSLLCAVGMMSGFPEIKMTVIFCSSIQIPQLWPLTGEKGVFGKKEIRFGHLCFSESFKERCSFTKSGAPSQRVVLLH